MLQINFLRDNKQEVIERLKLEDQKTAMEAV